MFGIFKKKVNVAKESIKRLESKDLMEAMVGGCLLIAFADGDCEEAELLKMDEVLRTSKSLEGYGAELTDTINRFVARLKAGYIIGRAEILREINDVKGSQTEKEDVLLAMLTVAMSDGQIEPEEQKELTQVAQRLGLRIEDYV